MKANKWGILVLNINDVILLLLNAAYLQILS